MTEDLRDQDHLSFFRKSRVREHLCLVDTAGVYLILFLL